MNPGAMLRVCSSDRVIKSIIQDQPSKTSLIFYFGLEGLGGFDMDTDENENVGQYMFVSLCR
jgi:hypothetical protein